jgi:hypothetical protein
MIITIIDDYKIRFASATHFHLLHSTIPLISQLHRRAISQLDQYLFELAKCLDELFYSHGESNVPWDDQQFEANLVHKRVVCLFHIEFIL